MEYKTKQFNSLSSPLTSLSNSSNLALLNEKAAIQRMVSTVPVSGKLNIIGEDHTIYDTDQRLRQTEEALCIKYFKKYWQEPLFMPLDITPGNESVDSPIEDSLASLFTSFSGDPHEDLLKSLMGDPPALRVLSELDIMFHTPLDENNLKTQHDSLFNIKIMLERFLLWKPAETHTKGIEDNLKLIEAGIKEQHNVDSQLIEAYKTEIKKLESHIIGKFPSANNLSSPPPQLYDNAKSPHFNDLSYTRSILMYTSANASNETGIWKVGDYHRAHMQHYEEEKGKPSDKVILVEKKNFETWFDIKITIERLEQSLHAGTPKAAAFTPSSIPSPSKPLRLSADGSRTQSHTKPQSSIKRTLDKRTIEDFRHSLSTDTPEINVTAPATPDFTSEPASIFPNIPKSPSPSTLRRAERQKSYKSIIEGLRQFTPADTPGAADTIAQTAPSQPPDLQQLEEITEWLEQHK